jgi:hypothetical protein
MPPRAAAPAPKTVFNKNHFNETIIFLIVLLLIGAVVQRYMYYTSVGAWPLASLWSSFVAWFIEFWAVWKWFAAIIIIISVGWAIYNRLKLGEIEKEEEKIYGTDPSDTFLESVPVEKVNEKWTKVLEHLKSTNPSDWRLAIIEADIMLDGLLRAQGYHGDSIGDMLKSVEPSDMLTLQIAWEAHLVRNRIAHAGSAFELNERETKRVIALFEQVFREFQII